MIFLNPVLWNMRKMNKMKCTMILLSALTLGGCFQNQAKDVAVCQKEADRFYQSNEAFDASGPRSRYIIGCMASKGYHFDITPADCDSRRPLSTQPTCYAPNGWLAWIANKLSAN